MDMHLQWVRLDGADGPNAGRSLLAQMYAEATGQPMPSIAVTGSGKPYFLQDTLHFSISHTPCHAFCCLSRTNVGIDAEEESRQVDLRLAERYFSQNEQARLAAAEAPRKAFLRIWVLKEAYAKLTGHGIGNYLKNTDFSPDDPRISQIDGCFVAVITEEGEAYAV